MLPYACSGAARFVNEQLEQLARCQSELALFQSESGAVIVTESASYSYGALIMHTGWGLVLPRSVIKMAYTGSSSKVPCQKSRSLR